MFMPLFDVAYSANAEYFCQMLLEVAAFDAIPSERINQYLWNNSLQLNNDFEGLGKFENLGYDGPFILANLTSTLVMLSTMITIYAILFMLSYAKCCCIKFKKNKKSFLGEIFWNQPIKFMTDSFSVISICCILNLKSWQLSDNIEKKINSIFAIVLLVIASLYPILMHLFIQRNKFNVKKRNFERKFKSAYDGLKTDSYNLVIYPLIFLYRRLTIPLCVVLMKD